MTKPLALVAYENLLPGSQLVNKLRDLGYRVQVVNSASQLAAQTIEQKPLLVFADVASDHNGFCHAIGELRRAASTCHIPVVVFVDQEDATQRVAAQVAGATLIASGQAALAQLPQLIEQALQVD